MSYFCALMIFKYTVKIYCSRGVSDVPDITLRPTKRLLGIRRCLCKVYIAASVTLRLIKALDAFKMVATVADELCA